MQRTIGPATSANWRLHRAAVVLCRSRESPGTICRPTLTNRACNLVPQGRVCTRNSREGLAMLTARPRRPEAVRPMRLRTGCGDKLRHREMPALLRRERLSRRDPCFTRVTLRRRSPLGASTRFNKPWRARKTDHPGRASGQQRPASGDSDSTGISVHALQENASLRPAWRG